MAVLTTPDATFTNGYTVQQGDTGPVVLQVRSALESKGLPGLQSVADPMLFDQELSNRVLAFQTGNGLPPTGTVDVYTWNALTGQLLMPAPGTASLVPAGTTEFPVAVPAELAPEIPVQVKVLLGAMAAAAWWWFTREPRVKHKIMGQLGAIFSPGWGDEEGESYGDTYQERRVSRAKRHKVKGHGRGYGGPAASPPRPRSLFPEEEIYGTRQRQLIRSKGNVPGTPGYDPTQPATAGGRTKIAQADRNRDANRARLTKDYIQREILSRVADQGLSKTEEAAEMRAIRREAEEFAAKGKLKVGAEPDVRSTVIQRGHRRPHPASGEDRSARGQDLYMVGGRQTDAYLKVIVDPERFAVDPGYREERKDYAKSQAVLMNRPVVVLPRAGAQFRTKLWEYVPGRGRRPVADSAPIAAARARREELFRKLETRDDEEDAVLVEPVIDDLTDKSPEAVARRIAPRITIVKGG